MALNRRQTLLYQHRMAVYRKTRNGSGDYVYQIVHASLPCYFFNTTNSDQPAAGAIRVKQDNIFTYDQVHFEAGLDIKDEDVLQNITPGSLDNGTFYMIMGAPDLHEATTRRATNFAHAYLNIIPGLPLKGVG